MLTISGLRNFYFLPNMTDMRCGYNRIMEIVRTVYGRDPYDGDVYFYMSKNQRTVRMVNFEHHQYCVHTYTFDKGYRFMRIVTEGYKRVYKVEWKDVLAILESPVIKEWFCINLGGNSIPISTRCTASWLLAPLAWLC